MALTSTISRLQKASILILLISGLSSSCSLPSGPPTEQNAEEVFRSMEQKLLNADSLAFSFKGIVEANTEKVLGENIGLRWIGNVHSRNDNRLLTTFAYWLGSDSRSKDTISFKCDGSTFVEARTSSLEWEGPYSVKSDTVEGITRYVRICIARFGVNALHMSHNWSLQDSQEQREAYLLKNIRVSDFAHIGNETVAGRKATIIEYSAMYGESKVRMRLWIDTEAKVPIQRSFKMFYRNTHEELIEEYGAFSTENIPVATFQHK